MSQLFSHLLSFLFILPCSYSLSSWKQPKIKPEIQQRNLDLKDNDGLPECWPDILPVFNLFTRGSEKPSSLSHIVVMIHGFNSYPSVWAEELAEAVLTEDTTRARMGALTVDWREGSRWENLFSVWSDYSRAVGNTRCLAEATTLILEKLVSKHQVTVHCIGHSLGAHVCGFIANHLRSSEHVNVERITGLDPAGIDWTTRRVGIMQVQPMEILPHVDTRLDASDAALVDIIHTDGNFAGSMEPMGHVDFYVGRSEDTLGSSQKGCGCTDNCDHARSFKMFIESVRQPLSVDKMFSCEGPRNFSLYNCEVMEEEVIMGYFYKGGGIRGVVGVMVESKGAEAACAGEEEGKEDDADKKEGLRAEDDDWGDDVKDWDVSWDNDDVWEDEQDYKDADSKGYLNDEEERSGSKVGRIMSDLGTDFLINPPPSSNILDEKLSLKHHSPPGTYIQLIAF